MTKTLKITHTDILLCIFILKYIDVNDLCDYTSNICVKLFKYYLLI